MSTTGSCSHGPLGRTAANTISFTKCLSCTIVSCNSVKTGQRVWTFQISITWPFCRVTVKCRSDGDKVGLSVLHNYWVSAEKALRCWEPWRPVRKPPCHIFFYLSACRHHLELDVGSHILSQLLCLGIAGEKMGWSALFSCWAPARLNQQISVKDFALCFCDFAPWEVNSDLLFLQQKENSTNKRANCRTGKAKSLSLTCWEGDAKIPFTNLHCSTSVRFARYKCCVSQKKMKRVLLAKGLPNHTSTDLCRILKLSTMSVKLIAEE